MKYKCTYRDGGKDHEAGIWEKKETSKMITFIFVDNLNFEPNYKIIKVKKETKKCDIESLADRYFGFGNVLDDWLDGTYTAYPSQSGIPYYFEPILF